MASIDKQYHPLLQAILDRGYTYRTENRPDVEMRQITSANLEIGLDEFPAITTKKLYWKGVVAELIWFLRGDDNIRFLVDNGVHIWDKDAYNWYKKRCEAENWTPVPLTFEQWLDEVKRYNHKEFWDSKVSYRNAGGEVGRNYGVQWRAWSESYENDKLGYTDQIDQLITNLRKPNPISRRHIVTAWNPAELDQTALPPCHWAFEVLPRPLGYSQKIGIAVSRGAEKDYLETLWNSAVVKKDSEAEAILKRELAGFPDWGFTLKWHQRSVDTFLGLPFNIASYGLLAEIIGYLTGMMPLSLIGDLSNVHIYGNHIDAVKKQLSNSVIAHKGTRLLPSRRFINDVQTYREGGIGLQEVIERLEISDFELENYTSFGPIKAEMIAPKK